MIDREKLSRVTLFSDLAAPAPGGARSHAWTTSVSRTDRVLRQGLSNGGLLRDPRGCRLRRASTGTSEPCLNAGRFLRRGVILSGDVAIADVVAIGELRCAVADAAGYFGRCSGGIRRSQSGCWRRVPELRAANEWQPESRGSRPRLRRRRRRQRPGGLQTKLCLDDRLCRPRRALGRTTKPGGSSGAGRSFHD